jgi:hypothetical protein
MFSYSVKFVCGVQNPGTASPAPQCSPVRPGIYATEVNIHNFHPDQGATIKKSALLLIHNDEPVGREPRFVKKQPFASIQLPPETATMDDCCGLAGPLHMDPARLNVGFLEIVSDVELNITAVYTATDAKLASISIDIDTINARQV